MRFSRLLLIAALTLPMSACFRTAEEVAAIDAARDDAHCRDAGLKPGTPAYAKCREDIKNRRAMSDTAMRIGAQNQQWSMQEMNSSMMMQQQTLQMMRH
jgi:CO dehydrogenase nickel-insertion accessory protein CooC1